MRAVIWSSVGRWRNADPKPSVVRNGIAFGVWSRGAPDATERECLPGFQPAEALTKRSDNIGYRPVYGLKNAIHLGTGYENRGWLLGPEPLGLLVKKSLMGLMVEPSGGGNYLHAVFVVGQVLLHCFTAADYRRPCSS